jgi:LmbE family N-acetylglucosaminyl deacetylase
MLMRIATALLLLAGVGCAGARSVHTPSTGSLLIVLAHGDDPISIAPLTARATSEGHRVHYALFTGVQNAALAREDSPERAELRCAARALGVQEPLVMSGPAGDGPEAVTAVSAKLREWMEQVRPDVVITWGPDGLTGHPRHVMVGNVTTRIFQQQRLLSHRPRKLYYIAYPESRFPDPRVPTGATANIDGPFGTVTDAFITTRVDGKRYADQVRTAIACHTLTFEPHESCVTAAFRVRYARRWRRK